MTEPLRAVPDTVTMIEDAALYEAVETAAKAWDARDQAREERDEALTRCDELERERDLARDVAVRLEQQLAQVRVLHTADIAFCPACKVDHPCPTYVAVTA